MLKFYNRHLSIIITTICGLFLCQMCSDSGGDSVEEQVPSIKKVVVNANWNLAVTKYNKVEATVFDPQGNDNIDSVVISFSNSIDQAVLIDQLYDDGAYYHENDGDVIAGDGIFSNQFDAATNIDTIAGEYQIKIQVFDRDGNSSDPSTISINLGISLPSEFAYIKAPDTLKSGTQSAYLSAALSQSEGLEAIESISFSLYKHNPDELLDTRTMFNDGDFENSGDEVADDSIFSYKLNYSFAAERQGLYDLGFTILDKYGTTSNSERYGIYIENKGGEIYEVSVPDSMEKPIFSGYNRELITASVTDPQGLTDVDSVYFYSQKPDGTLANSGDPILLVDNGKPFSAENPAEETGDEVAGDGIFSFSLLLDNTIDKGMFIFSFYMRDKVGNLSVVKKDSVEVY